MFDTKIVAELRSYARQYASGSALGREIDGTATILHAAADVLEKISAENLRFREEEKLIRQNCYSVETVKTLVADRDKWKARCEAAERALNAAHSATRNACEEAGKRLDSQRKPIDICDITWLGIPYFAEYKGVDKLFIYVTGDGIKADFAAARKLGWNGETLGEFWRWEEDHGKLQVRLWEAKHSPPTDEERAAVPWKEADRDAS